MAYPFFENFLTFYLQPISSWPLCDQYCFCVTQFLCNVVTVVLSGLISFTVLFYSIFLTTTILLYIFYADNVSDIQY